ncbi:hypothetical protein BTO05_00275 [Winogradskyella sp. PC-19]|uniref:hypothetical protein n=1 Tax=unclassified Winogradskyella TaxID=2615021 RepID=UPI000B3D12EF|nr:MULTISPECIES: hypothetical protein [unclassified Winogradskyella]ARV08149.1 hypothetical protein BTO05_00275 [Winogradskyella sp. PC-19]
MEVVGQSENIRKNLQYLFDKNFNRVKSLNYKNFVDYLIDNNEIVLNNYTREVYFRMDEIEITEVKNSLKNFKISSIFEKLVKFEFDEILLKNNLKSDLKKIISKLQRENLDKFDSLERQVLFISFDNLSESWCSIYGKGDFPILKNPEYFDYDYSNQLFQFEKKIDSTSFSKPLFDFERIVDELDLYNQLINDFELYNCIYESYKYKYFLLLNEVLSENDGELFKNFPIIKPFYIYGNEHDCEYINLHIIE